MSTGYLQAISWKDVKVEGGFFGDLESKLTEKWF